MKTNTIKYYLLLLTTTAFIAGCNKDDESLFKGNDNYIVAFTLVKNGVTLKGALSPDAIIIAAPERFSLSGATATVTLSENATITPDPSTITNWDEEQAFTITSYNGAKHRYAYRVERHLVSHNGDVILLSQADVNDFTASLKDVDQINGSLTIGAASGQDTIHSLAGMEHLKVIIEGITINTMYMGEDITAFENLEKTGELVIKSKKVKTVRFPKLATMRLDMNIDQATAIKTLDFPELTTIDKSFRIYYVDSLASIGFPKLQQVIENVTMQGRSNGTQNLHAIDFPALQTVGGSFTLSYWREVTAVNIPALTDVKGAFAVSYLTKINTLAAPKLETAGTFSLSNCTALAALDFPALKTVNGNLSPNATALAEVAFPALETVAGLMSFATSATLTGLQFPALTSAGSLTIPNAANLATLHFPALKYVKNLLRVDLTKLASLDAFPALDSIGGTLYLYNLTNLTSIIPPSLKRVGTINASGLTNLTEIDVRNVDIGSLELTGTTMTGLTLIGNDEFPGKLLLKSPVRGMTGFPVTIQSGFKTMAGLELDGGTNDMATVEMPWLEHVVGLLQVNFRNSSVDLVTVRLPNLQSAGRLELITIDVLELPALEEITGYASGATTLSGFSFTYPWSMTTLSLPKLKRVTGDMAIGTLTSSHQLTAIQCPALDEITGTLTLTGTSYTKFTDLSGFSTLKKAGAVTITGFPQLRNFEPLKSVIPALNANTWKIVNCGYNPTYDDMQQGKYTN
ncbi:MAG: hypothetical protein LBD91_03260 [Prevotellaceae bacterium]|jgi:hypothetical protein|nr:hypothetical protein [Prevotellaceae bacterium]